MFSSGSGLGSNKAIKLTTFPSLVLWLNATLPQNNQLQSRNLWRRYAASAFGLWFLEMVGCFVVGSPVKSIAANS
jgi:hypothetical protein